MNANSMTLIKLILLTIAATDASAAIFTVTNTNNTGAGSLRQAVLDSNNMVGNDSIVFNAFFNTPQTITLASTITLNPATGDSLTITGPGANLLTVSGNNAVGIFFVSTGDTASISGVTLTLGDNNNGGAAIDNRGTLSVANAVFTSNVVNNSGGAIVTQGALTVSNSTFDSNSAGGGGAIDITGAGSATISNSIFINNTAGTGGAIDNQGGPMTVTGCTFTNNIANGGGSTGNGGGAIYNSTDIDVTSTIANSTFTGNQVSAVSGNTGGAIRNRFGAMTITDSTFTNNSSQNGGGAISTSQIMSISGSTFTGNSTTSDNRATGRGLGGAITAGGQLTIADTVITGNSATNSGGGIYWDNNALSPTAAVNITNSTISNNTANSNNDISGDGGGLYIGSSSQVTSTISGSTISGNVTNANSLGTDVRFAGHGGGIYAVSYLTIENSTISGNHAELTGGGIHDESGNSLIILDSVTVVNNTAGGAGGVFSTDSGSGLHRAITLRNSIIANNASSSSPDVSNAFNSEGYNLIENTSGASIGGTPTGNIIGVDPNLGPLTNNGGPTHTHALLTGSPAIDAGNPTTFLATDQRGIARPQDGDGNSTAIADIGAYEKGPGEDTDTDGDGVPNAGDNCPTLANPDQIDSNGDGFGNRCDADLNNDGMVNAGDLALMKATFYSANADADFNGDGRVNFVDLAIMKSLFNQPAGGAP